MAGAAKLSGEALRTDELKWVAGENHSMLYGLSALLQQYLVHKSKK